MGSATRQPLRRPLELPCPAQRSGRDGATRRALFLLDHRTRQITGAIANGKVLNPDEALTLWQRHRWRPTAPGQHWPEAP